MENSYQLIAGKTVAAQLKKEMADEVIKIKNQGGKIPH
jgi:hypothetical protein